MPKENSDEHRAHRDDRRTACHMHDTELADKASSRPMHYYTSTALLPIVYLPGLKLHAVMPLSDIHTLIVGQTNRTERSPCKPLSATRLTALYMATSMYESLWVTAPCSSMNRLAMRHALKPLMRQCCHRYENYVVRCTFLLFIANSSDFIWTSYRYYCVRALYLPTHCNAVTG